ncbi:Nucleoporin NUP53 [Schistosoma japonicum]|uniref:Nucleoporin NUP35 n=1 Tax=Schistosoma japonicum TaxID=6182 RepID=A0A4Z2DPX6_SCHJA|nr:Nucleoporin NUP53 [Schistosoma japonicum]
MIHGSAYNHNTEPMNLGSPPVNSFGPGLNTSPPTCQYLPGFLMSENPQTADTVSMSSFLESKGSRQNANSPLSGNSQNMPAFQYNMNKMQPRYLSQAHESIGRRLTSPPTRSMWSAVSGGVGIHPKPNGDNFGGIKHSTPNYAIGPSSMNHPPVKPMGASPFQSPADSSFHHRTPLYNVVNNRPPLVGSPSLHNNSVIVNVNDGNNKQAYGISSPDSLAEALLLHRSSNDYDNTNPNDCWVTVFGFPPSRAAFILNQFAQLGTIEKHVITNSGNWMHIKYQNRMQARCALNKNGKVFGDNTMVGVSVCTDSQIMNDDKSGLLVKQTTTNNMNDSIFLSPSTKNNPTNVKRINDENYRTVNGVNKIPLRDLNGLKSLNGGSVGIPPATSGMDSANMFPSDKSSVGNIGRHNSMRSLAAASTRPIHLSRTSSVRQDRDPGIFSKALGYMFGWS